MMLKGTEAEETIVFFETCLPLVVFQLYFNCILIPLPPPLPPLATPIALSLFY